MSYPIVFIQRGDTKYLLYVLAQAKASNPNSEIHLIGDNENNFYNFVTHHNIDDFLGEDAKEFEKYYKHLSMNSYDFELICFQRWFILKEFMSKFKLSKILHLDSDVMLYNNLENEKFYDDVDWALSGDDDEGYVACGEVCFINNLSVLNAFCKFMTERYKAEESTNYLKDFYKFLLDNNFNTSISDMILTKLFLQTKQYSVKNVSLLYNNDFVYDENINLPCSYKATGNIKKIIFKNKMPSGMLKDTNREIIFKSLHFQGDAKNIIPQYYNAGKMIILSNTIKRKIKKFRSCLVKVCTA